MTDITIEKQTNRGGARIGAGRKKTLPDGTKTTTFLLTEEERKAVKKFISEMRETNQIIKDREIASIREKTTNVVANELYKIINLYEGRKGFRKAEETGKLIGIVAFKDAVSMWENENPREQEKPSIHTKIIHLK